MLYRKLLSLAVAAVLIAGAAGCHDPADVPVAEGSARRIAVVMCQDSYDDNWLTAQSSSQALVGLAGLIGVSYRTLTLAELLAEGAPAYASVWFSACIHISEPRHRRLVRYLQSHLSVGGSVFLDGPLGARFVDDDGEEHYRGMEELADQLGVVDTGWENTAGHAVAVAAPFHLVSRRAGVGPEQFLTPGLRSGTETLALADPTHGASHVLLELVSPERAGRTPFLVTAEPSPGARVAAINSYGTFIGPASPFRNKPEPLFYDNQLVPYLVETLIWLIAPDDEPFVGLQLSAAPMTVIGRLDGDWSDEAAAASASLAYLNRMAEKTGVATIYGVVSAFASDEDAWPAFAGGVSLEATGGVVGSHSRTHPGDMSRELAGDEEWTGEVAHSIDDVRRAMGALGADAAARAFINPGSTIRNADYGAFFGAIDVYLSHGFELFTPYSSGVIGFGLPQGTEPVPVVNDTLSPDYQWLYLSSWDYTVEEAAELQTEILGHYQHTIGRGVLYNQMWHDYALSGMDPPMHYPDTATMMPLFDANVRHFSQERIYAPAGNELIGKMHIAHKAMTTSGLREDVLDVQIDYSRVAPEHRPHAAGMGLRVNYGAAPIRSVIVDGASHDGFTDDTVILPAPGGELQLVRVEFGSEPAVRPRLSYSSKAVTRTERVGDRLVVTLATPGLATRVCIAGPRETVVLHADESWWDGSEMCGRLAFGSPVSAVSALVLDTGDSQLVLRRATRAIEGAEVRGGVVRLTLAPGPAGTVTFGATGEPADVRVDGQPVRVEYSAGELEIAIPPGRELVELEVVVSPAAGCGCESSGGPPVGTGLLLVAVGLSALRRRRRALH